MTSSEIKSLIIQAARQENPTKIINNLTNEELINAIAKILPNVIEKVSIQYLSNVTRKF